MKILCVDSHEKLDKIVDIIVEGGEISTDISLIEYSPDFARFVKFDFQKHTYTRVRFEETIMYHCFEGLSKIERPNTCCYISYDFKIQQGIYSIPHRVWILIVETLFSGQEKVVWYRNEGPDFLHSCPMYLDEEYFSHPKKPKFKSANYWKDFFAQEFFESEKIF